MWYALAYFPDLENKELNGFRRKYDPTYPIIEEHMPLLFMIPDSIDMSSLENHIREVLDNWNPFSLHFNGLMKTWDHWLLLTVREGAGKVMKLHDALYSGILKEYLRTDIPFDPHIGLGLFASDTYDPLNPEVTGLEEDKFKEALEEAEAIDFDFWCRVDLLTLIKIEDLKNPVKRIRSFSLKTVI